MPDGITYSSLFYVTLIVLHYMKCSAHVPVPGQSVYYAAGLWLIQVTSGLNRGLLCHWVEITKKHSRSEINRYELTTYLLTNVFSGHRDKDATVWTCAEEGQWIKMVYGPADPRQHQPSASL